MIQEQGHGLPKLLKRLGSMVGCEVVVQLKSCPELQIKGLLDCFLLDETHQLIAIDNTYNLKIVNLTDVSFISIEHKEEV